MKVCIFIHKYLDFKINFSINLETNNGHFARKMKDIIETKESREISPHKNFSKTGYNPYTQKGIFIKLISLGKNLSPHISKKYRGKKNDSGLKRYKFLKPSDSDYNHTSKYFYESYDERVSF